jgi:glycosyltransferase involved in cell wall biosynthesis
MKIVAILLATYNGAKFLQEQLESLSRQTYTQFNVLIRDDGSSDTTMEIVRSWAQNDSRFRVVEYSTPTTAAAKGPINSFFELLDYALKDNSFDYFFLCDQDDIWSPTKIESQTQILNSLPANECTGVFSDLLVIDEHSKRLCPSLHRYLGVDPFNEIWPQVIVQNIVTGCTLGFNRKSGLLFSKTRAEALKNAIMHDHWMAILVCANGILKYTAQPLVAYRQHSLNASGGIKKAKLANKIKDLINAGLKARVTAIWNQALTLERLGLLGQIKLSPILLAKGLRVVHEMSKIDLRAQGSLRTFLFWLGTMIWKKKIAQLNR